MIELFLRRTAGLTLLAFTALFALAAATRLDAWENTLAARRSIQPNDLGDLAAGAVAFWVIAVVGLVWHWRRLPMWRIWCRWAAFPGVFMGIFHSMQIAGDHDRPIGWVIAVGLVGVPWALSELVVLVMSRPVTSDRKSVV